MAQEEEAQEKPDIVVVFVLHRINHLVDYSAAIMPGLGVQVNVGKAPDNTMQVAVEEEAVQQFTLIMEEGAEVGVVPGGKFVQFQRLQEEFVLDIVLN